MSFQNPLSRRGEIARGPGGRFMTIEENITAEHIERSGTPIPEETNPAPEETCLLRCYFNRFVNFIIILSCEFLLKLRGGECVIYTLTYIYVNVNRSYHNTYVNLCHLTV